MAPRNSDANSSFKKGDDNDVDVTHILPCLLHKKHKVVKLIKSQMENISQEGLFTNVSGCESEPLLRLAANINGEEVDMNSGSGANTKRSHLICYTIFFILLLIFGLIVVMVLISAGPLSNSIPHTPITCSSFVRTDCLCSHEKKYLLRWSKPEYFE